MQKKANIYKGHAKALGEFAAETLNSIKMKHSHGIYTKRNKPEL